MTFPACLFQKPAFFQGICYPVRVLSGVVGLFVYCQKRKATVVFSERSPIFCHIFFGPAYGEVERTGYGGRQAGLTPKKI